MWRRAVVCTATVVIAGQDAILPYVLPALFLRCTKLTRGLIGVIILKRCPCGGIGIRSRLRTCAREGVLVRVQSGALMDPQASPTV